MARVKTDILAITELKWTGMGKFNSDDHYIYCCRQESHNEVKGKGEKERYTHLNSEFQRIARRDKKVFLSDQCNKTEENNRMSKTRQENYRYQGNISCKDGLNKGQK